MFGWKEERRRRDAAGIDESSEVYQTPLPPTMPVVKSTIDTLVELAVKQRLFLLRAGKLKVELVKERLDITLSEGAWFLNGFSLSDEDAIDLVRASPDTLSLFYANHKDTTSIWTNLRVGCGLDRTSRGCRASTSPTTWPGGAGSNFRHVLAGSLCDDGTGANDWQAAAAQVGL